VSLFKDINVGHFPIDVKHEFATLYCINLRLCDGVLVGIENNGFSRLDHSITVNSRRFPVARHESLRFPEGMQYSQRLKIKRWTMAAN
jgi:hypothetical protein